MSIIGYVDLVKKALMHYMYMIYNCYICEMKIVSILEEIFFDISSVI